MLWDPEVESPASIAIIGAGPVGIEAALYARYLGYDVDLYDSGRPGRQATRWHQRSMEVPVRQCTTKLGHRALAAQDDSYAEPAPDRVWTGQAYAEEYLTPVAKTDLVHDSVRFNCSVVEVCRSRSHLDELFDSETSSDVTPTSMHSSRMCIDMLGDLSRLWGGLSTSKLQERCDDEFRLIVHARDKGYYTARADLVIDCRGHLAGLAGWGPGGSQSIGAQQVESAIWPWLPGDARFEWKRFVGKQTIVFGQSPTAQRFVQEWSDHVSMGDDYKLIWLIPMVGTQLDHRIDQFGKKVEQKIDNPKCFSLFWTLGIERVEYSAEDQWRLHLVQPDDTRVEIACNVFAPYPSSCATPSLGPQLLPQSNFINHPAELGPGQSLFYPEWEGWRAATFEPHYYRLGSRIAPHDPHGLTESYQQIQELFALLGTRRNLSLYQ